MKNALKYSYFETIDVSTFNYEEHEKKAKEYKLWHDGVVDNLLYYYKTYRDVRGRNGFVYTPNFFRLAPTGMSMNIGGATQVNNFTVYHNPVANIVSRAMSNLLFANQPIISINMLDNQNLVEQDNLQERINMILAKNKFGTLSQVAAESESYSGAIAFKAVLDPDFSDEPIIQIYPKEEFIVNRKYDKVVSIVFLDSYQQKQAKSPLDNSSSNFILFSEYGYGFIKYKLLDVTKKKIVSLDTLPETSGLEDIVFYDKNTNKQLDIMLAVYKENKPGARSDYENSIDDFTGVDEVYSQMMNFIRKTAPKRVVSEQILKKNEDGIAVIPSVYDMDLIIQWDNNGDTGTTEKNDVQVPAELNNSIQGYIASLQEIQKSIARTVGLSIKTIMGEDLSGANASAESLSIRENTDFRTRDNKKIAWIEALKELTILLLTLDTAEIRGSSVYVQLNEDVIVDIEMYNPAQPTTEQMVKEINSLDKAGLIDEYGKLYRFWVELSKSKSVDEVNELYEELRKDKKENQELIEGSSKEEINPEKEDEEDAI